MPTTSFLYALIGVAVLYLFQQRRQQLQTMTSDDFPEFDIETYQRFVILLKTAYERMLYLGVLFFPLAWSVRPTGERITQYFFLSLIFLLFLSNIFPRHSIMKLLEENELTMEIVKKRGFTL